jgi:DNA-directed RNA polymerase subunit RPC12/RpoP
MAVEPRNLDGNALGGLLIEVFGEEMTQARERCAGCGSIRELGALIAYTRGPGDVLRCPDCGSVLLVAVRISGRVRVSSPGIAWLETP